MSKKRNNISYVKPADPKFLQQLKEQIGFTNSGPTIESKRQRLENDLDSGSDYEGDEEAPQVVVLRKGDLTAEEVEQEKERVEKEQQEEDEKPADLSQRIVFKSKKASTPSDSQPSEKDKKKSAKKQSKVNKSKLSFQDDEEEDE